jgi:hypothetical protein
MISDVGRWVGQRISDVRSAIFEFLLLPFISRLKSYSQNSIVQSFLKQIKDLWKQILLMVTIGKVRQKKGKVGHKIGKTG